MHIDDPIERSYHFPPQYRLRELLSGHDMASITQEGLEQGELRAGELQLFLIHPRFPGRQIQTDVTRNQTLSGRRDLRAAPKYCPNARDQLARIEGFCQIIIGSELKAENAIQLFAACREDQHRDAGMHAQVSQY